MAVVVAITGIASAMITSIFATCFSGYGASAKPSMAEMAALADIPVKIDGVDGSQVEAYVEAGRLSEVADYCLTDVLATYGVFLQMAWCAAI